MKMSDKFDLPLKFKSTPFLKDNSGCNPIYSQSVFSDLDDNDRVDRAEYACYAINNHDRLTEENAKLRDSLELLSGSILDTKGTLVTLRDFDLAISSRQLLNQLKD